tara:strand:- start:2862 stop:4397 length:1536 start_codon:yes stop_codon:yes gene_type:complete
MATHKEVLESYVKKILTSRVYEVATETPLDFAPQISSRLGAEVFLKREDLQPIFSFKNRGAYAKISNIPNGQRKKGVIAASAGNHAQGVAVAAAHLNIDATIVMGLNTPEIKVEAVRRLGAKVILHGDTYDDASDYMKKLSRNSGAVIIPPYDDPDVIAGQGTVGMEILNQIPGIPNGIFVPVGGGGLIAGVAAYAKYLNPNIRIIGVESEGSDCLNQALRANRRVRLNSEQLDLFADGVSVAQVGRIPFLLARNYVDEMVLVDTDEICAAIKDIFDETRSIAEPAGALAIAGMKKYIFARARGYERYVAIVSGANVNFDRLRHISERAEYGEHREVLFGITIPEKKGSFRRLCKVLGKRPITEFNYRYQNPQKAEVFMGLKISEDSQRSKVLSNLNESGYVVEDMTGNEMAKLHLRHMVGGGRPEINSELVYRFEFPERPGALRQFLDQLGKTWNITLFHYRNHGAAWGRVLVGFDVSERNRRRLVQTLRSIGYRFWEETNNPAYTKFLR